MHLREGRLWRWRNLTFPRQRAYARVVAVDQTARSITIEACEVSMPTESVAEKVREIVGEELAVEELAMTDGAALRDDLGADSLNVLEILMDLEAAYDIDIPDEDVAELRTVGELVAYVERRVGVAQ